MNGKPLGYEVYSVAGMRAETRWGHFIGAGVHGSIEPLRCGQRRREV